VKALVVEVEELTQQVEEQQRQLGQGAHAKFSAEESVAVAVKEVQALRSKMEKLEQRKAMAAKAAAEQAAEMQVLQGEVESLREALVVAQQGAAVAEEAVVAKLADLEVSQQQLASEEALRKELAGALVERDALAEEMEVMRNQASEGGRAVAALSEAEAARGEAAAKTEAAERRLAEVSVSLEALKEQKLKEDARVLEVMKRLKQKTSEAEQAASVASVQLKAAEEKASADCLAAQRRAAEAESKATEKEAEVASLSSRLDRLQRISKQKRAEYDDIQAKLASTAGKLDEADKKLGTAEKRLAEEAERSRALQAQLAESGSQAAVAESVSAELEAARKAIAELEKSAEAKEAAAAREAAALKGKISATDRERVRAFEQVKTLKGVAKERNALDAENKRLVSELEALRGQAAHAAQELRRLQQVEANRDRLQNELAETTVMLADTEARMRQLEEEMESTTSSIEQERNSTAAAARAWQEELEGLLRRTNQRDAWPAPVRRLVEERERIAAESAKRGLRKEMEEMERMVEDDTRSYQEKATALVELQKAAAAAHKQAAARMEGIEAEIAAREASLVQQLEQERSLREQQVAEVQRELAHARRALAEAEKATDSEHEQSAAWAEKMQAELHRVRDRARELMAERDSEIAALKARLRTGGVPLLAEGADPFQKPEEGDGRYALPLSGVASDSESAPSRTAARPEPPAAASTSAASGKHPEGAAKEAGASLLTADAALPKPLESLQAVAKKLCTLLSKLGDVGADGALSDVPVDLTALRQAVVEAEEETEATLAAMVAAEEHSAKLAAALEDSERTHTLRDTTADLLKEEIAELRRNMSAGSVDTLYLKTVLVNAWESGELSHTSPPVLTLVSRLLHFSPEELQRCQQGKPAAVGRKKSAGIGRSFHLPVFLSSSTTSALAKPPSSGPTTQK